MRYKVTFYQAGVEGFDPEYYRTKAEAQRQAADFLRCFRGTYRGSGYRYSGSIRRDGFARWLHPVFGTDAMAEVHTLEG